MSSYSPSLPNGRVRLPSGGQAFFNISNRHPGKYPGRSPVKFSIFNKPVSRHPYYFAAKFYIMKAIQLEQFGIGHLQLKEIPTPVVGENEVLVKTTAVSLEFHDLIVVENRIPFGIQLPHIPVSEGVGVVESVGSKVTRWKKGDRVIIPFISRWEAGKNTPYNDQLRTSFSAPGLLAEYTVQP